MKKSILPILALLIIGCQNARTPKMGDLSTADSTKMDSTKQDKIAILKSFYKATQEKQDTLSIGSYYANGYTEYGDGTMPPKIFPTPDSIVINYTMVAKIIPDATATDEEYFLGDSGKVLVLASFKGTWNGISVRGQKATGKSYHYTDADVYTLDENGKITSHRNVYPFSAVAEQVGYMIPKKK